jgi:DNA-binding GntR family transcriptional regulator
METTEITNSTELAYQKIQDSILNYSLKPGEVVTEIDLSENLGLSRTPVREAIRKLENDGLIVTHNRTKTICFLTDTDIEEIFDLKIAIESLIARQAAEKGTTEQMNTLGNLLIEMRRLLEKKLKNGMPDEIYFEEWLKIDDRFHQLLFEMSDNNRAQQIVQTLNMQWHRIKVGLSAIEGRTEKTAAEHEAIGKAIIQREPEAAEMAVNHHLYNLKIMLLRLMRTFNY